MQKSPLFWMIAGPNGVGKSTWASSEESTDIFGDIPVLNPDHFGEPYTAHPLPLIASGKRIFSKTKQLVANGENFAVETTLSGNQYFRLAESLKQKGWEIGSVFIGVKGEDVCISRVEERKLKGGHDVPIKDIIRRYQRSYQHIPRLIDISDYMIILDNSETYQQVLEKNQETILINRDFPEWLRKVLAV